MTVSATLKLSKESGCSLQGVVVLISMALLASDDPLGSSSESASISAWPVRRQRRQHASRQMDAMRQQLDGLATRVAAVEAFIDKNPCSDLTAMIKHEVGLQLRHAQVSIRLSCNQGAGEQNHADRARAEVVSPIVAAQPEYEANLLAGLPPGLGDDACGEDLPSVPATYGNFTDFYRFFGLSWEASTLKNCQPEDSRDSGSSNVLDL